MNIESRLKEVRAEYLRRMTRGDVEMLQEVERYVTARSGKMLRPRMTLAAAATLGEAALASRDTLLAATCVEMLHNVSLLHDDVVDEADERRGQASVNARWGNRVAVLVGDYLLAQTMSLLNEIDDAEKARIVNKTVMRMAESELLAYEVESGHAAMTRERYTDIIDGKTASLFATAAALGNREYEEYGLHYGRLFQLRDDMADGETTPYTEEMAREEEELLRSMKGLDI